jgi:putative copper export protein
MDSDRVAAINDARELRLVIRRYRLIAVSAAVVGLLSLAGALIVNRDPKPTFPAAALTIVALLSFGGAIIVAFHAHSLRSVLKDIERAIDRC